MNNIFRKLTVRNIKSNLRQFLSVILIVLLGSMLMAGFITNSYSLEKSVNAYFEDTNLADMWVYVSAVDDDDIAFYDSIEGITYDERLYIETTAIISSEDSEALQNNVKIYVSEGKICTPYISGTSKTGCYIDKSVAENYGITLWVDEISFTISYSYNGTTIALELSFVITDTMTLDECADTYSSWPVFIDEETFLTELNSAIHSALGLDGVAGQYVSSVPYNQILIKTEDFDGVSAQIEEYYEGAENSLIYIFSQDSIESVMLLNSEISQSKKMIYVFPVIFLIVSVLVILTTIDQLILQEKSKIGTLKSIGIPDRKILRHYSKYGAVLCLIGSFFGILLGIFIIPNIMFIKYNLVYSLPSDYMRLYVPIWWIILVFVAIIALGYLVSFSSCYKILHKKPIECLRFEVNIKSKVLSKNKGRFKSLPLPIKMASRNIRIKVVRTIMATIGIAGCFALLLCGFGISDTLNYSVSNDLEKVFKFDITTTYSDENFITNLAEIDGVEYYETYENYYSEVVFDGKIKNANVYKISQNSELTTIKLGEGDVFISNSLAEDLGVEIGDEVIVSCGGTSITLTITQMGDIAFYKGIYVAFDLDFDSLYCTNGAWITVSGDTQTLTDEINEINGTNTAMSKADLWENVESKISSISLMTTTLKVFAILLAVIVLLNLIILILKERTREIATLKVLGQGNFSISLTIFFEVLFMALIGMVVGSLLGYPLLVLVLKINSVEVLNFIYHINALSYFLSVIIVFATIVTVSLFCLFKVKKVSMIESLKSVE